MGTSTGGSHLAAIGRNKQVSQDPQHSPEVGQSSHFCCSSPGHHPQLLPVSHLSVLDFQGTKSPEDSIQQRCRCSGEDVPPCTPARVAYL